MAVVATGVPPLGPADAELFAAARLVAARQQPYLAAALFALVPVAQPGLGTFAVDKYWRVYLDMDAARRWGVPAAAAVLVHEAHHVLRAHADRAVRYAVRRDERMLWNVAGDAAINDDLRDDGLPLPPGILPETIGEEPHGLEEVYFASLRRRRAEGGTDPLCGSGSGGDAVPGEIDEEPVESGRDGVDEVDAEAVRQVVAHEVVRAHERGEATSPGLVRWARDLLAPQVSWRRMLRSTLGRTVREVTARPEPTWNRPNRRADVAPDVLVPGVRHVRPDVAVVVDTSASMSRSRLDAAVTEIGALLHRHGARDLTVVVCDVEAVRPQRVRRLGELVLTGGGDTDLRVGIDAALATRPRPSVVVVLTDGLTPWPPAAAPGTTIVAVVIGDEAPLPEGPGIRAVRIDESC